MKTFHFTLLFLLASFSSLAIGREIYVNNLSGDDRFNGKDPANIGGATGPVRSLERAIWLAQAGDRIVLAKNDEPYRESVTLWGWHNGGDVNHPFTIQGNGAVLDGSAPVPPGVWEHYSGTVFRFRPPRMGFAQLFLGDKPLDRVSVDEQKTASALPKLEAMQWCLRNGEIFFCVEKDKLPNEYRLSYAALPVGITLLHVNRVVISELTVQGYQLDGINAANSATEVLLTGLILRGNGRSGLAVGGASSVKLNASLLGNNGFAQFLSLPYSHSFLNDADLLSNTAPAWVDQGGQVEINGQAVKGGMKEMKGK